MSIFKINPSNNKAQPKKTLKWTMKSKKVSFSPFLFGSLRKQERREEWKTAWCNMQESCLLSNSFTS